MATEEGTAVATQEVPEAAPPPTRQPIRAGGTMIPSRLVPEQYSRSDWYFYRKTTKNASAVCGLCLNLPR